MPATSIAFTFPGQGSQKPGMGNAWVGHPSWELVAEASIATGRDLEHLLLRADADELRATRNSQLATMVASLVVLDAVERLGVEPALYAGHSLGEYTALVAAGALSYTDGVKLVSERGEAMQSAGEDHPGTMAAVMGLDDDKVEASCSDCDGEVWVANFNAPGQVVIAGHPDGVVAAGRLAKERGAKKVIAIPVSGAFHTPLMAPARNQLIKAIAGTELRTPDLPIIANVDARVHTSPEDWADLLVAQLCSPVRWRQTLYELEELGATTCLELGIGSVLSSLAKRTVPGVRALPISTPEQLDKLLEAIHGHGAESGGSHEGEHIFATERMVVSPGAGVFEPDPTLVAGIDIVPGQLIGRVGDHEVRSSFTGSIMGVLAVAGERVTMSQPIAWLRAT